MRVVLITGAAGGLGGRLAAGFDASGYRVVVHYFRSSGEASRLQRMLKNDPRLVRGDIGNFDEVREMAEVVERDLGRLDVLVNNAAITRDGPLLKYPETAWDDVMRTNLKGTFNCIKNFAPLMIRSGGGHIINISSYSGLKGKEGQAAYSASKAAILGLTRTLARELSEQGIRVNAVVPGYLPVGMGPAAPKAMEGAKAASITGSLSDPADVVGFITCLAGSRNITGQVFPLESRL